MSVLIVEDDPGLGDSLAELLTSEGYTTHVVRSGEAALAFLTGSPVTPSIILLDLVMHGMGGGEFRKRQLADPRLAEIPVIVMSARPDGKRTAQQLGAADCLLKPMSFEELLFVIQNLARTTRHELEPPLSPDGGGGAKDR